ncbi:MAG: MBL fold metallo-hydrolase [Candidatus Helarchaeota archaeon]
MAYLHEIAESLYWIEGEGNALFPFCHSYVYAASPIMVFDPQCGLRRLRHALRQIGHRLSDIKYIVNTHFHLDHSAVNSYIKRRSSAQILIHEADRAPLEDFDAYVSRYGINDKSLENEWRSVLKALGYTEISIDITLKDGTLLPGDFQTIHTPGHTPGHCCFFKNDLLIAGDIDLTAPWLGNLSSNVADFLNSIDKLQNLHIKTLLPSHGTPHYTDIPQKLEIYRQRLLNKLANIQELLSTRASTLEELTQQILNESLKKHKTRRKQAQFTFHFAKVSTLNYLQYLELKGIVKCYRMQGKDYWSLV